MASRPSLGVPPPLTLACGLEAPDRRPFRLCRGMRKLGSLIKTRVDARAVKPEPKRADPELLTAQHREFRLIVCRRAGWQCEWVENGKRCTRSAARGDRMIGDHKIERADGGALYDPANGQCLCVPHNTRKGIQARAARLATPSR